MVSLPKWPKSRQSLWKISRRLLPSVSDRISLVPTVAYKCACYAFVVHITHCPCNNSVTYMVDCTGQSRTHDSPPPSFDLLTLDTTRDPYFLDISLPACKLCLVATAGMDRLHLGSLLLDLRAAGNNAKSEEGNETWFPLTPDFLGAGLLTNFSTSDESVALLADLLADPGIGFEAECRVTNPYLVVRCSLIPSDGRGGDWRRKPKKDRSRSLRRVFAELRHGWDIAGDRVLAKRVS